MNRRNDVKFLIAGQIQREFIIDVNGRATSNQPGGSLLYAAAALHYWGEKAGLLAVIDHSVPATWIEALIKKGLDARGIKTTDEALDLRAFQAYLDERTCLYDNPAAIYASHRLTFPQELLDYQYTPEDGSLDSLSHYSRLLLEKIPDEYMEAAAAHICPLDGDSQIKLSAMLEKGSIRNITLQPHRSTMVPERIGDVVVLCKDATAIFVKETELRDLFRIRAHDLWEMTAALCSYGCRAVVVKGQQGGYLLHDAYSSHKYLVPDYPVQASDPTGENEVFCGAFLMAYQHTYDPLSAAITGSATASLKREASGPFSLSASLPGLAEARMETIRNRVVQV